MMKCLDDNGRDLEIDLSGGCVISLGNFDGVHIGHRFLLQKARELAGALEEAALPVMVLTFWPHPRVFLRDPAFRLLYGENQRKRLIEATGNCDILMTLDFTKEIMSMSPEAFARDYLIERYHAKGIVVGDDFRFGKEGRGDSRFLKDFGSAHQIQVRIVPRETYEEEAVSSSRIRQALTKGKMEEVNAMLKEPYCLTGTVEHGKGLGRQLKTPTINLPLSPEYETPRYGVYASKTTVDGVTYDSITNVGNNPTFGGEVPRTETYLLHYEGNLYGKEVTIQFHKFIRPEITFDSANALRTQLQADIETVKEYYHEEVRSQ